MFQRSDLLLAALRLFRHAIRGIHICLLGAMACILLIGVRTSWSFNGSGFTLSVIAMVWLVACLMIENRLVRTGAARRASEEQLHRVLAWLAIAGVGVMIHMMALIAVLFGLNQSVGVLGLMFTLTTWVWIIAHEWRRFARIATHDAAAAVSPETFGRLKTTSMP